jgi:hypothetical protein
MTRILLFALFVVALGGAVRAEPIVFQAAGFEYRIAETGTNLAFIDRASGVNYLRDGGSKPCAWIEQGAQKHPVTAVEFSAGRFSLRFASSGIEAVLRTEARRDYLLFTVEAIRGGDIQALTFLDVPLKLQGVPSEAFGACVLSLNLFTRVDALPALQRDLGAACTAKFGLIGAKVALVAAPMAQMLTRLQEVLAKESELPVCQVAGPWARETPFAHGSYLFNFGAPGILERRELDRDCPVLGLYPNRPPRRKSGLFPVR